MANTMLSIALALVVFGVQKNKSTAVYLVTESQFTFMASTQTTVTEYWITVDKLYQRLGTRVTIVRTDRGVQWDIDMQAGTYSESRLISTEDKTPAEDIRTAGFSYEPDFAWTITGDTQTSTINGRPCHFSIAKGVADFAEMTLKLGLCQSNGQPLSEKVNRSILSSAGFRYRHPVTFVTEFLSNRPELLLMSLEATVEPPISSTMNHRVVVRSIENSAPPAGIFDLPAGIRKIATQP
jgi:hypothetical protein